MSSLSTEEYVELQNAWEVLLTQKYPAEGYGDYEITSTNGDVQIVADNEKNCLINIGDRQYKCFQENVMGLSTSFVLQMLGTIKFKEFESDLEYWKWATLEDQPEAAAPLIGKLGMMNFIVAGDYLVIEQYFRDAKKSGPYRPLGGFVLERVALPRAVPSKQ
jgi:hypothetical protein